MKTMSGEIWVKMAENKAPELTSSHGNTKTTTAYRTAVAENDLKTGRTDFLQLRINRESHIVMGRSDVDVVQSGPTAPAQ